MHGLNLGWRRMRQMILAVCMILLSGSANAQAPSPGDLLFTGSEGVYVRPYNAMYDWSAYPPVPTYEIHVILPFAWGVTSDAAGRVFATGLDREIYDVTEPGDFRTRAPHVSDLQKPRGIVSDRHGRLLVAEEATGRVLDASGGGLGASLPVFASGLAGPTALIETWDGRILVGETTSGEITDITAGGDFTGATALVTGLQAVHAIAENSIHRRLYVTEGTRNGRVLDVTVGGAVTHLASLQGVSADYSYEGLFVDRLARVHVAAVRWGRSWVSSTSTTEVGGAPPVETLFCANDHRLAAQFHEMPSEEVPFERRDLRSSGDGLVAFDPASGLEWLNLNETKGVFLAEFDWPKSRVGCNPSYVQGTWYQDGWRHATAEEVETLLVRYVRRPGPYRSAHDLSTLMRFLGSLWPAADYRGHVGRGVGGVGHALGDSNPWDGPAYPLVAYVAGWWENDGAVEGLSSLGLDAGVDFDPNTTHFRRDHGSWYYPGPVPAGVRQDIGHFLVRDPERPRPYVLAQVDADPWHEPNDVSDSKLPTDLRDILFAIRGSEDLDVTRIRHKSLRYGIDAASPSIRIDPETTRFWTRDLNSDGWLDLVVLFTRPSSDWGTSAGSSAQLFVLSGETIEEVPFSGCSYATLQTAPLACGGGFEFAFLLPLGLRALRRRRSTAQGVGVTA